MENKVLIIDDEKDITDIISDSFQEAGFTTVKSHDIAQARTEIKNNLFDIIIIDFDLKGQNTAELIFDTISRKKTNEKPFIFLASGSISDGSLERIKPYISGNYVKPFSVDKLIEDVQKILEEHIE